MGSQGDPPGASSYVPEPPARVAKFPVRVGGDQEDKEDEPILDADSKQKWNILDRVTIWFLAAPPHTQKTSPSTYILSPTKLDATIKILVYNFDFWGSYGPKQAKNLTFLEILP